MYTTSDSQLYLLLSYPFHVKEELHEKYCKYTSVSELHLLMLKCYKFAEESVIQHTFLYHNRLLFRTQYHRSDVRNIQLMILYM